VVTMYVTAEASNEGRAASSADSVGRQYITRAPGPGPGRFGKIRTVAPAGMRSTAAVVKNSGV